MTNDLRLITEHCVTEQCYNLVNFQVQLTMSMMMWVGI